MKYVFYVVWLLVYARSSALRRIFLGISRPQQIFIVLLIGLLLVGQLIEKKYPTYPFVKWGMYAGHSHKGSVYSYSGVRADGTEFRLPMTDLVRTHSKRYVWRLRELSGDIRGAQTDADRVAVEGLYDRLLRDGWALYRKRHPEPELEIVAIRVRRLKVDVRRFKKRNHVKAVPFREVPI